MNDLLSIVQKFIRLKFSISNGDIKIVRYTQGKGCVGTGCHKNMKKSLELHRGRTCAETDPDVIEAEKNNYNEASLENNI